MSFSGVKSRQVNFASQLVTTIVSGYDIKCNFFVDAISQFLLLFAIAKWCDDRRRSYFWNFCRGMLRSMGPIFARKKGPSVRPTVLFDIIGAVAKNVFIASPYHQFWMICARSRPRVCTRKYYSGLISLITRKYEWSCCHCTVVKTKTNKPQQPFVWYYESFAAY